MAEGFRRKLNTGETNTWCPGCPDHMIEEAAKQTVAKLIDEKKFKHTDFAMTADIGCHAKIFDYFNISGIYCLHGRALPTAIGMKLGNPNLKVLTFVGDGALYSEGMEHWIHAFVHNPDMTLIVHDNQAFSLTTGQASPTSPKGFAKSKAEPMGVQDRAINPLAIALASGATFIARTNARDIKHMVETFTKAIEHKGFSYVEVMQDCIIFNLDINNKDNLMYKVPDNKDLERAKFLVGEYDYNKKEGKIPLGILYQSTGDITLEEKWPQLKALMEKKLNWQDKDKISFV